ncbi:hypothetical protein GLOIN_2v1789505 [Rhizophagus irregularis DAOM 181602=DAOM 197198]|uniref:MULE transposase domain-containing protein n=1 Tax=Rhizophagus irregularis (strain DAOM 181602 / DAOM 197198 / MUCL 43194) TaxID=747089 RepID=A0A2P4P162_RHIID|nr:hypothetical protein GLOIN_2v1789505 [Rhizophagus irregularis DAOM 181602=DAOM 197198]POG59122.1 hypothetical protein GLOIN_2v1789505 [Rhizophagus irregularis DAOM 181602=DAOM 197198]|eukprot:XP_025165988.1 hypothetical protein GLOIN_2v1789505 [Rhizophagus irregularis DAOM 181602=DAOM 197198]
MSYTNFVNKEDIIYEEDLVSEEDNTEIYITKNITVKTIIHSLTPLEYPPTSEEGTAIIYHVEGWQNIEMAFEDVQYSMGLPCGQNKTTCTYLGDIAVIKKDRTCHGVKICEFADPELREMEHKSVDPNSDLRLRMSKELSTDNVNYNTFAIKENVDLNLLQQLLNGLYEGETDEPVNNCYSVFSNSTKRIYCPHPHRSENTITQGKLMKKLCEVRFSKLIPVDIKSCPFVILISKGIHTHPPPPPNQVPVTIRTRLQELIHQANNDNTDVTPTHIITGNLIKTYFGVEYLSDIHASLNNTDRLRYYIDKIQKEIHPQGQGLLGVVYNYSRNINNFRDYVKRLEFFEDEHVIIVCTTSEQLNEWIKCKHFQIDLSFKRVMGEINEFEINYYSNEHNLILTFARVFTNRATTIAYQRIFRVLFDLVLQLTGSPPQFKHIHGSGWNCIIADLDYAQAKGLGLALNEIDNTKDWEEHLVHIFRSCLVHYKRKIREKGYNDIVKNKMIALLTAESESAINQVFDDIQAIEENAADWITFYRQKWVIASLNKSMSKIANDVWITSPDNTNVAESAHALSNRRGRDLKLLTAILHGQKLDKERFTTIYVHQKYNIPNKGRDKGLISRNVMSNKRNAKKLTKVVPTKRKQNEHTGSNKKTKTNIIEIEENDKENICTISSRKIKTRNGTEGDDKESEFTLKLSELEFQERALALRERELILREKEAKIREMELSLAEKEHVLNSTK